MSVATVMNIARGSIHDGPGIRTVVYLKGCTLHCKWCHNPEGIDSAPAILFNSDKCIGCGICTTVCPAHHCYQNDAVVFYPEGCSVCGKCVAHCPVNALEKCGDEMTADQLFLILQKDQPYYVQSGGGVTFSGGECMLYPDFLFEVMELCKNSGIHVAVESALNVPYANLEKVLPVCDLWLVDFKHPDTVEHKQYTGCGNERIQENLAKLCKSGSNILVRCPMIPGVNDIPETVRQLAEAVYALGAPHVELLKYNPLGKSKYNRLGLPFTPFAEDPQSDEQMRILCGQMNATVQKCDFVFFTP